MALEIGSRLGHYDVTALIGEGGMGQVYQATIVVWLLVGLLFAGTPASAKPGCLGHPVAVQVLGSGGPASVEGRASSSYLVWIDGRARVLVDVGGGSLVRYGKSGARIADLDVLAVSHLHPDHVSDLPGLLWHAFVLRPPSLPLIVGPSGSALFPSMSEFLNVLVDPTKGAFRVLSGVLEAEIRDIDVAPGEVTTVLSDASVVVDAQSCASRAGLIASVSCQSRRLAGRIR